MGHRQNKVKPEIPKPCEISYPAPQSFSTNCSACFQSSGSHWDPNCSLRASEKAADAIYRAHVKLQLTDCVICLHTCLSDKRRLLEWRCVVPVCTWRWWFLWDGSAWGSWSRWHSPEPCPPPSSFCGRQGANGPVALQPARQKHKRWTTHFWPKSFRNVFKSCDKKT